MSERPDLLSKAVRPFAIVFVVALAVLGVLAWVARPTSGGKDMTIISASSAGARELPPASAFKTIAARGVPWRALCANGSELLAVSETGAVASLIDPRAGIQVTPADDAGTRSGMLAVAGDGKHTYAVGRNGLVVERAGEANAWKALASPSKETLFAVAVGGAQAVAAGAKGVLMRIHDGAVELLDSGVSTDLRGVAIDGDTAVAVGRAGVGVTCDLAKRTCTHATVPPGDELFAITHANGSYIAVGAHGAIARLTGGAWSHETSEMKGDLYAVAYGLGVIYAVGQAGYAVRRADADSAWTREQTDPRVNLVAVAVRLDTVYVAGAASTLFERPVL